MADRHVGHLTVHDTPQPQLLSAFMLNACSIIAPTTPACMLNHPLPPLLYASLTFLRVGTAGGLPG
jgi:hypothetical protein